MPAEQLTNFTFDSGPCIVSRGPGLLDVFVVGEQWTIVHNAFNAAKSTKWTGWKLLPTPPFGIQFTDRPAVASPNPNRMDVFARGSDNRLKQTTWTGSKWSTWKSLGENLASAPAACSWGGNRIDVFFKGTDKALWWKVWDGSWHAAKSLGGGALTSDPAASSWQLEVMPGLFYPYINVCARGTNNVLRHRANGFPTGWSAWKSLGGNLAFGPGVCGWFNQRITVFAGGASSNLQQIQWTQAGWGNWEPSTLPPPKTFILSEPDAVSWASNRIDVVWRAQDFTIWHGWQEF